VIESLFLVGSTVLTLSLAQLALGRSEHRWPTFTFWVIPPSVLAWSWVALGGQLGSLQMWLYAGTFTGTGIWILSAPWVAFWSIRLRWAAGSPQLGVEVA